MKIEKWLRNTIGFILLLGSQLVFSSLVNSATTVSPIPDQSNNETEFVSIAVVGASDIAGATLSYSATGLPAGVGINAITGRISGTLSYTSAGTHNVTVTATDNSTPPQAGSTNFVWTVTDVNRAPFKVDQGSLSIEETKRGITSLLFGDLDNDIMTVVEVKMPAFVKVASTNSQPGSIAIIFEALPGINDAGVYTITASITDNKSPAVTNSTTLTVLNLNQPPQITNPGPQTNQIGDSVSLTIVASDPDQDVLVYSAQNLPAGLTINSATGIISGTITNNANPAYSTTVFVADGTTVTAAQAQTTFEWTITAPPPTVSILSPGDQTNAEGDTVNLPIAASASNGGAMVYSATGLPPGLTIDATGTINGNLDHTSAGNYAAAVTVQLQSDPSTAATTNFNWLVTNTNRAPVANAGLDENVTTNEIVALDGSTSYDPDDQMLTFVWRVISVPAGSTVTDASLSGAATPQASFTPDVDGAYTLDLEVSDGSLTAIDSVVITAATPPNVPPNAVAGPDQQVEVNTTVVLNGAASNDPDNYPQTLSYRWYFRSVPTGSALVDADIVNAASEQASFTPDVIGDYIVGLEVSDGLASSVDELVVTATYTNAVPVANAGMDQTLDLGTMVQLDGSASSDSDQYPQPMTYAWSIISVPTGSAVSSAAIANANMANASFMPDVVGVYLLRLDVSDGEASAFDQVTITVKSVGQVPTAPYKVKLKFHKHEMETDDDDDDERETESDDEYGIKIKLSWKSSATAVNYYIYRKKDGETSFTLVGQTAKRKFKERLPYGTRTVEYYVVAQNQYGMSKPSVVVSTARASYRRHR